MDEWVCRSSLQHPMIDVKETTELVDYKRLKMDLKSKRFLERKPYS